MSLAVDYLTVMEKQMTFSTNFLEELGFHHILIWQHYPLLETVKTVCQLFTSLILQCVLDNLLLGKKQLINNISLPSINANKRVNWRL